MSAEAKKAEAAIVFFESKGRQVSGVSMRGKEITISFAPSADAVTSGLDLVSMDK